MPFMLLPALNIALAISSGSIPAIPASFLAVLSSSAVHVGERNRRVSEMIAEHRRPAIFFGISTPASSYI